MKTLKLTFIGIILISLFACKKDKEEEEKMEEVNETEQKIMAKDWRVVSTTTYGQFDINTDTIVAGSDTNEVTVSDKHMNFNADNKATYTTTSTGASSVEYNWALNSDNTKVRLWENASSAFPALYSDYDYEIITLNETQFILKGNNKRHYSEHNQFTTYFITQQTFEAL